MRVRVSMEGDRQMKAKLASVAREFPKEARKGARELAEEKLLAPAVELAPEKSGKLKRSGKVTVSIRKGGEGNILATVKFTEPYATLQHETHKTKSKFLERPLRDLVPVAGEELRKRINIEAAAK